jgi:hypothetical protein
MKRSGHVLMVLLVAAGAVPCGAADTMTIAMLKEKAAADAATPEGKAYLKEFFTNPWHLALDTAGNQCRDAHMRSATPEEWVLGLSIGSNGYPNEAVVTPGDNEGLKCLADRLKASGFIKPPHDDFAIYMPVRRTEPGTENRSSIPAPEVPSKQ